MSHNIGIDAEIDKIRLKEQNADPEVPESGYGYLYATGSGLYFENSGGSNVDLTESGGCENTTATIASRPAAGTAGNLFFPTDGTDVQRDSGTVWVPWGPIYPITRPPVLSNWTWINQGTASASDISQGGIYISDVATSSFETRILKKSLPSTPYTITVGITPLIWEVDYNACGLCLRQSSDGKLITIGPARNGTSVLDITKCTNPSTYSAGYSSLKVWCKPATLWLRVADDNTNRIISVSFDGPDGHFMVLYTVGRTDFLTPDEIGFFVRSQNAAAGSAMVVHSWKEA